MTGVEQLKALHDELALDLAERGELTLALLERMERQLLSSIHRLKRELPNRSWYGKREWQNRTAYRETNR